MPTETVQNYLKAIYQLGRGGNAAVPLGELARDLNLTPGTVTVMVRRMDECDGLVTYRKREGAVLTSQGRREALRVLRRHRLIELFLVEAMGFGWEEVHEEAERLEHAMSDRLVARIAELLGHPEYDPHGTPIPAASGKLPDDRRVRLSHATAGWYSVMGFADAGRAFRSFCTERGIARGGELEVLSIDPEADIVTFRLSGKNKPAAMSLGGAVAEKILLCRIASV